MKRHRQVGFSLLELLIAVAIVGVILSLGVTVLPRDRIAVNQAVERFERDIQRARFNAISYNTSVVFVVDEVDDGYRAVPDPAVTATRRAAFDVNLEREGFGGVAIALGGTGVGVCTTPRVAAGSAAWDFDARGVGRQNGVTLVRFQHRSGFEVALCVNAYGKVERL